MKLKLTPFFLAALVFAAPADAQETRIAADTVAVQADAMDETDPDLATLAFQVSVQERELRKAYERAGAALGRIRDLATRHGIPAEDVSTSAFTVFPIYDWGDRRRRARAYRVEAGVEFRLKDFTGIAPLIDEAIEEGIVDLRSLTYSLADEESAKRRAVSLAMRRAEARARAALEGNGRGLGPLRHASVDVQRLAAAVRIDGLPAINETIEVSSGAYTRSDRSRNVAPLPLPSPEKIRVSASVQCVYQLQ